MADKKEKKHAHKIILEKKKEKTVGCFLLLLKAVRLYLAQYKEENHLNHKEEI